VSENKVEVPDELCSRINQFEGSTILEAPRSLYSSPRYNNNISQ
jgi:predicted transcriptional regulator